MKLAIAIGIAAAGAYVYKRAHTSPAIHQMEVSQQAFRDVAAAGATSGNAGTDAVVDGACKGISYALPISESTCSSLGKKFIAALPTNKWKAADAINRRLNGACKRTQGGTASGDALSQLLWGTCWEYMSGCAPFSKCSQMGKCKPGTQPLDVVSRNLGIQGMGKIDDGGCPDTFLGRNCGIFGC